MKKFGSIAALSFYSCIAIAQNVGIGTTAPAEKLDVNGNLNISGQLKVNNDAGAASQVLTKNAANLPVWADLYQYKNFASFYCLNTAATAGSNNCTETWMVPAGVTTLLIECWGGGGGGGTASGGNGGGYIVGLITVTPGNIVNMTIGAGGKGGSPTVNGTTGGNTSATISGTTYLEAYGGPGGKFGDPAGSVTIIQGGATEAGYGGSDSRYIKHPGKAGSLSLLNFSQVSTNDFARIIQYGRGGDAGNLPGSGGTGGYRIISTAVNQAMLAINNAADYGGGGGADSNGGANGRGGRVTIRW